MPKIEISHHKSDQFRFKQIPQLLFAGQVMEDSSFYAPPQIHGFCEIIYIAEGSGEFNIGGKTYELHQGDAAIYNPGVTHEERSRSTDNFKVVYCGLEHLYIEGIPQGMLLPPHIEPVISCDSYAGKVESYLSEILQECESQVLGYETICSNLLMSLITVIYRIIDAKSQYQSYKGIHEIALRTKHFIDKNYTQSFTLKDIADTLYVSPHYMSHLFKKELGHSPINYMISRRIEEAKRILCETDRPVHEIASQVGYTNEKYFSMLFKKMTGITPTRHREIIQSGGNLED
ncbi:AraC family transcriptional regulator [Paenibacillus lemnae]|uniref:AraC family transcriptional regulator n=1 Tax=Paenibacillus lemnae TaxID=1330551 RepID=A0A848MCN3_PAELE|nr:AraC family transcriptional regulator [Paenibacillus lemnae]NMO97823.1 AraC family transcriptional regulator [Paenibacillus lemnae]